MTKEETQKVIKKIKAYYYYFELDKDSIKIWTNKMLPYAYEDLDRKVEEHIVGEDRQNIPRIQDLIRNLLTEEQKAKSKDEYLINCNLCKRIMTLEEYDLHYDKCSSINYLIFMAKKEGKAITREQLENTRGDVLNKLYEKYKPEETHLKAQIEA